MQAGREAAPRWNVEESVVRDILIVDDEPAICSLLARLVRKEGWQARIANAGRQALDCVRIQCPSLMLLDYRLPDMTGEEVLREARQFCPDLPVVVITAYADVGTAVASMRAGAVDYLAKPFDHKRLLEIIHGNLPDRRGVAPIETTSIAPLEETMGSSDQVRQLVNAVRRVAFSNFNVLVMGETGTGKELVSRAIHSSSSRKGGPFVSVDCGALPEQLLESELFGYERGAFTGAFARTPGKFEVANGGTLFLDEVSNLPMSAQAKLLRATQERALYRVGGTQLVQVDVRIVAACNTELLNAVEHGKFRSDLYFRLNEFALHTPPLRERREDIPYLVQRFIRETNSELHKSVCGVSPEASEQLQAYPWPGNVRQLRNVVRRAVLLAEDWIDASHLDLEYVPPATKALMDVSAEWESKSLRQIVRDNIAVVEKEVLAYVLHSTGGNKLKAARLLSIDYKTLLTKVKEYGL